MSKSIHEEKGSIGSKPNKKNKNEEWAEESFNTDTNPSRSKTRKKTLKKVKNK